MVPERDGGYLSRPEPSGLADVVEIMLDKGIVVDAYARVSALGIEVLTVDARVVISSVDTYLRFAEATNRLDLYEQGGESPLEVVKEGTGQVVENVASKVAQQKTEAVVEKAQDAVGDTVGEVVDKAADKAADAVEAVARKVTPKR